LKIYCVEGGVASHSVPTAFLKSWILSKYRDVLLELWQEEDKSVLRVDVAIRKPNVQPLATQEAAAKAEAVKKKAGEVNPNPMLPMRGFGARNTTRNIEQTSGFSGSPLDAKHTFESFIEGNSNRMVHAAARTIADDITASHFNPLIIHAGVGMGKTHILQAIAWRVRNKNPKARVLYLTAEYFMWRFASSTARVRLLWRLTVHRANWKV